MTWKYFDEFTTSDSSNSDIGQWIIRDSNHADGSNFESVEWSFALRPRMSGKKISSEVRLKLYFSCPIIWEFGSSTIFRTQYGHICCLNSSVSFAISTFTTPFPYHPSFSRPMVYTSCTKVSSLVPGCRAVRTRLILSEELISFNNALFLVEAVWTNDSLVAFRLISWDQHPFTYFSRYVARGLFVCNFEVIAFVVKSISLMKTPSVSFSWHCHMYRQSIHCQWICFVSRLWATAMQLLLHNGPR